MTDNTNNNPCFHSNFCIEFYNLYLLCISYLCIPPILGDPGADSGDQGKSKRAEKYDTKKSKERREEPLGTMSYQTSSNGRRRSGF